MRELLFMIAIVLLIGWIVGAFILVLGQVIHLLFLIALVILLMGFNSRRSHI